MVTNAFNKYSIFGGATAGAAIYATTTFLTPATMGAITFAVSSFFASLVGAVAAVALGYALPILASMVVGALLAVAFNALYNAMMKPKATVTGPDVNPEVVKADELPESNTTPVKSEEVVEEGKRSRSPSNGG